MTTTLLAPLISDLDLEHLLPSLKKAEVVIYLVDGPVEIEIFGRRRTTRRNTDLRSLVGKPVISEVDRKNGSA